MKINYLITGTIEAEDEEDAIERLRSALFDTDSVNSIQVRNTTAYYDHQGKEV